MANSRPVTFDQLKKHVMRQVIRRIDAAAEEFKQQLLQEAATCIKECFDKAAQRQANQQRHRPEPSPTSTSDPPKIIHRERLPIATHPADDRKLSSFLASLGDK